MSQQSSTFMNVFSGRNALLDFYNPDKNVPTPMVELPDHPFARDNVRIYAKLMNFLPAANIKSLPALNMLQNASQKGHFDDDIHTIVEYSSGSTAISLGMISRIMGIKNVAIYISNKTTQAKISMLRLFGLKVTLFGGPSQPEPRDPIGGIAAAVDAGSKPGQYNPNQYENPANYEAHIKWTGPQIHAQLPGVQVFCAPIGTSGTMTGTSTYLKSVNPGVMSVGAFTAPGQRIPGPRTLALMRPVLFPWRATVDEIAEITTREAFDTSALLCRTGLVVGPSSGMSLAGLYAFLRRRKDNGTLDKLRDPNGDVVCVFICCDFPFQYVSEYVEKCSPELFPALHNEELIGVDQHPYLTQWELLPTGAYMKVVQTTTDPFATAVIVLDFRHPLSFASGSIVNSISIDVGLGCVDPNPFSSPAQLRDLCQRLENMLQPHQRLSSLLDVPSGTIVLATCQNGTASRTATSVMRSRGIEACCVIGGIDAWIKDGLPLQLQPLETVSPISIPNIKV